MKQGKIYIIEDDETIVKLLKQHLSQTYEVFSVQNFRAIKQEVEEIQPDLILIDITLPYFNGFYWTTEIRKTMTLPIIFISSSDDEMDTVMALNMGGDDFVSKPFSLTILDAKISAFLRRAYQFTSDTYQLGAFSLSRDGVLSNGTEQISLSPTENKILSILFEHQNQVVTKEELLEKLWENDSFIDQNTLSVNMARLRKKITPLGFNAIHTVRGVGYLLKWDVIIRLYEQSAQELLAEQAKTEDVQSLVKMWSHQMKVPLSALSLMAQTNQLDGKEVQQQLTRLQNYLDTLLTYLKFSQNKDDFRFERLSVRDITIENVKKYRIPCLLKQLSIEVEGDWLLASDRKWLSFAISQILDNAIKYSKEQDKIRIEITDGRISISDNGIGILEEDLPRLFEEGFTGFNGHENQKATGLGLYMTKQILDSLNLAISITSQVDKGTQVTIALPKE